MGDAEGDTLAADRGHLPNGSGRGFPFDLVEIRVWGCGGIRSNLGAAMTDEVEEHRVAIEMWITIELETEWEFVWQTVPMGRYADFRYLNMWILP